MLVKLIKYDFLYTWKFFAGIMVLILCWGAIGMPEGDGFIGITITVILIPVVLAAVVLCVVFVLRHYSRSMYGRQGYLTMTLPVSPAGILGSKIIVTTFWFNVAMLVSVFSVTLFFRELSDFFDMFLHEYRFLIEINLSMISTLTTVYLAISVANVSVKGTRMGIWGGIGVYLGSVLARNVILQVVYLLLSDVFHKGDDYYPSYFGGLSLFGILSPTKNIFYWAGIAMALGMSVAAFFINLWLIRKKVSLQ